jgi:hypothetical protein
MTGTDSGFDLMTIDVDEYPELASEYKVGVAKLMGFTADVR